MAWRRWMELYREYLSDSPNVYVYRNFPNDEYVRGDIRLKPGNYHHYDSKPWPNPRRGLPMADALFTYDEEG